MKRKKRKIIMIFIILALFVILMIGLAMNLMTKFQCENKCKDAVAFQRIANGKFNIHDTCVCYYNNALKVFVLDENRK